MNPRPEFFKVWRAHWSCEITDLVVQELGGTVTLKDRIDHRDAPDYKHFHTAHGVGGLGAVQGDHLDVLAVNSDKPGSGQFRQFIEAAQVEFSQITFWSIMNDDMMPILARYGFGPCIGPDLKLDGTPSTVDGMRWRKADHPNVAAA